MKGGIIIIIKKKKYMYVFIKMMAEWKNLNIKKKGLKILIKGKSRSDTET